MKKIKPRRIFWTSFGQIDSVTLCLTDKLYEKECKKFGYDIVIVKDGVCTRFTNEGKRGECIIGISDKVKHDYVTYVALIAHEITHAVDFIMEEDNMSDMEFRAYAVQDMLAKSMMYIEDIGMFKNKSYKKSKETK